MRKKDLNDIADVQSVEFCNYLKPEQIDIQMSMFW
jgi:hypothetical protein